MKKSVVIKVISIFSLLFLSCSNNQNLKISYQDTETLKDVLKEKEMDTRWAAELEPDRLSKKLDLDAKIVSKEVTKDNQTVKILKEYQQPVFPQLEEFGYLDSTILTNSQKSFIDDFMTFVSTKYSEDPGEYFISEYKFNYQFFKQDLISGWMEYFLEDIPKASTEEEKINLFNKWIIGEPIKYENQIIIPVRAYVAEGYLNLLISTSNDVTIKLYNVQIEKWGN